MTLLEQLRQGLTYLDGGMGTLLQARGLLPGELPERWAVTHAETVIALHQAYYEAGSHAVMANTFGANRFHYGAEELAGVIRAAVDCAMEARRRAVGGQENRFVLLDIGPTGKLLQPYGPLPFEEAVAAFAQVVRLGAACGVDGIMIETMNDSLETKAALLAARENCDLPVLVSNAFGGDGKLMTGADPEAMVALLEGMGAAAVGVNCSLGPEALAPVVRRYLAAASVPVLMKPNAGLPREEEGKTVYDIGPEAFAAQVAALVPCGLRVLGGCCGTTPDHIRALVRATQGLTPLPLTEKGLTVVSSGTHAVRLGEKPVIIGERINPTGKKKLRESLQAGDLRLAVNEGLRQQDVGADILDVNVGAPGVDEKALLTALVGELQAVTDLPLQIDTADAAAMEAALRAYNGKALINSVNGKQEVMDAIFPLVKKYGGVAVALTLDENGIPDSAEERVAIARRILAEAERYGIQAKDIVFDTLTMTVSADPRAAVKTLAALRAIRGGMGCGTVLGVSNVSFGLPERERVGSAFLTMALLSGLSAAIMNPLSAEMMAAFRSYLALTDQDPQCAGYIDFALAHPLAAGKPETAAASGAKKEEGDASLRQAVTRGLRQEAARRAEAALAAGIPPMDLVQQEILPALDEVGVGFEQKRVFLPQLMMSAEAAEAAFEKVKAALPKDGGAERHCRVVLATVRGDVHDIGKNIVRLLLENYGFEVTDLGRDVPPEAIAAEVKRLRAPVCGLSALMTTTVPAMEETIRLLRTEAPWCRVMVGGAVLTEEYARKIGADGYGKDAMAAVRVCEALEKQA